MKPVLVLTTVGAAFDARSLARELVELRVAACVNIVDRVHSVYRWEDAVTEDGEQLLLIKTSDARLNELRQELFSRHPYDVPELIVVAIEDIAPSYAAWLLQAVAP